jgi:hypothetical protein
VQRDSVKSQRSLFGCVLQSIGIAVLLAILGGCGPELSKSDLGTVVFEVPKVAGADKPYEMPKLGSRDENNNNEDRLPIPRR